ncbi:MAG: class I SAM-dependent methyltransferase [Candidatus Omnitrophica bacterium]|nr:class I SAM-dependent methyltransferase [Candidatus Omnitrophota bacterium]
MQNKHPYKEIVKKNNHTIINCKKCGYWHVYPMPTEEELNNYYETRYYENLGQNRAMTDKLNDSDGFYMMQYYDRLRHLTRLLPSDLPKTILDIGVGYGDFLRFMKKNDWETQGLELSQSACEAIKDKNSLNIKQGNINKLLGLGFNKCSVVTLNNVLEHLREPLKVIEIVRDNLLLPQGILLVIVPNDFSILQDMLMKTLLKENYQKHYYWTAHAEHLNYWSIKTMKRLLLNNGFKIKYLTGDFPMEIFPLMGEDYILYPEFGRKAHLKRIHFEECFSKVNAYGLKDKLFEAFAKIGIVRGVHIFVTRWEKNKYR